MEDGILIDVFRPLSRRLLSQSIEQVSRRFRRLVNSSALPNLHIVNDLSIIEKIFTISDELEATYRPPKYLRIGYIDIDPELLAEEQWRKCLWQFRHCFVDCGLTVYGRCLSVEEEFTAAEFQSFLVEQVLPLFSNCSYDFRVRRVRRNNDKREEDGLPTSSANLNGSTSGQPAIATSSSFTLLVSHPSLLNCMNISIWANLWSDPFVPIDHVIEWLHHSPTVPTTTVIKHWWKGKRNLCLNASILEYHGTEQHGTVAAANNLVKKIKERFLAGNASKEKCDFCLEIRWVPTCGSKFEIPEFDIRNDATNESLTFEATEELYESDYGSSNFMEDDILIDVFRPLSRRQLSQSIALVSRRFHRLANSPYLPNLHVIWTLWTLPVGRPRGRQEEWRIRVESGTGVAVLKLNELQNFRCPPQYLRFESVAIRAEHLAQEQWRDCLQAFRHCFVGCIVGLNILAMCTSAEFRCFLADRFLPLFPNGGHYNFYIEHIINGTDNGVQRPRSVPTLEQLANYNSNASVQKAVMSVPNPSLLSLPSLLNCSCLMIRAIGIYEPLVTLEDVVQWLHHVPTMPIPSTEHYDMWCKSKRNMHLSAFMIKPHGRPNYRVEGFTSGELLETANNLIEQIKKRFLAANTSDEKREFLLELKFYGELEGIKEFDTRNDATNENLTCHHMPNECDTVYCILRKSV
ncbi:hypothetical protein Ddc_15058 [Ditylenchus destructor]|nr:hypothetical protein Ddc_15058 [Ditylenchus destructor]